MNTFATVCFFFVAALPGGFVASKRPCADTAWFMVQYVVVLSSTNWFLGLAKIGISVHLAIIGVIYLFFIYWAVKVVKI